MIASLTKLTESAGTNMTVLPTLEEIESETEGWRLMAMINGFTLAEEREGSRDRAAGVGYLRAHIGPRGRELIREEFGNPWPPRRRTAVGCPDGELHPKPRLLPQEIDSLSTFGNHRNTGNGL